MSQLRLATQQPTATEPLVIQQFEEGFRVYAASEPKKQYMVSGSPSAPECTCENFQANRNDPNWQCEHILAVLNEFSDIEVVGRGNGIDTEERAAIHEEGRTPRKRKSIPANGNASTVAATQMLLRRSVSPDGRIDSLSIEFSTPLPELGSSVQRADQLIRVQSEIVAGFLKAHARRPNGNGNGATAPVPSNGQAAAVPTATAVKESAVPARLVNVAGMQGKWGRRLFINVDVNGSTLKLFGTPMQLKEHIRTAGYVAPEPFTEGAALNVPCRVTTTPSPDGRFVNVAQVLPATVQQQA